MVRKDKIIMSVKELRRLKVIHQVIERKMTHRTERVQSRPGPNHPWRDCRFGRGKQQEQHLKTGHFHFGTTKDTSAIDEGGGIHIPRWNFYGTRQPSTVHPTKTLLCYSYWHDSFEIG